MMGQGDKKTRIRRTNEQLDKEVISEFEKLVGELGFGNVNLSALMKAADLEANVFYRGSIILLIFPRLIRWDLKSFLQKRSKYCSGICQRTV